MCICTKQFALHESYEYRSKTCEVIIAEYHALTEEECDRFQVTTIMKEPAMVEGVTTSSSSSAKENNHNHNNRKLHKNEDE